MIPERAQPTLPPKPRSVRRPLLIAGGLAALCAGLWVAQWRRTPIDLAGDQPMPVKAVLEAFSSRGVDAGMLSQLLTPSDAVVAFARTASGSASAPFARAEALQNAVRARAAARAFVPWSLGEVRDGAVRTPTQLLTAIAVDGAALKLYPLELAALVVTALRTCDVDAMVAELVRVPSARTPRDASGYLGYFVVYVRDEKGGTRAFDPWSGGELPRDATITPLADASVIGAALSVQAMYEASFVADSERALRLSGDALIFAGSLPAVRSARGVIVLGAGMAEQALQELEAALQLRPDAPRLHNVASALLMFGEVERATTLLTRALAEAPDFAAARVTQALIARASGDDATLDSELARAEELAPDLSTVQFALAERMFAAGETDAALLRARRAVEARPAFDARLRYAVMLRRAARYDEMRAVVDALLKAAPVYRADQIRAAITDALGPTALEPIAPDTAADAAQAVDRVDLVPGAAAFKLEPPALLPRKSGVRSRDVSVMREHANSRNRD